MPARVPFLINRDIISPLQCEDMVLRLRHTLPNTDQRGNPTVTFKSNALSEMRIHDSLDEVFDSFEAHYGVTVRTVTPMAFEWYPTGFAGQTATCEGSTVRKKRGSPTEWRKVKDYDFTGIIFLNDFSADTNFDGRFEVRGGKLDFPTHGFGFNPARGTVLIYPCCSNFVNAVSPVELGDSNIVRFHIVVEGEYVYNIDDYPGGYKEWFPNN